VAFNYWESIRKNARGLRCDLNTHGGQHLPFAGNEAGPSGLSDGRMPHHGNWRFRASGKTRKAAAQMLGGVSDGLIRPLG
jgi:hypothetical protein